MKRWRLPAAAAFLAVCAAGARADGKAAVTYARDVAPILRESCVPCHRAGEVAPFALETYAQATQRAKMIKAITASRVMPPWKAESHGEFLFERRLSDAQIAKLAAWADAGAPSGDLKSLPPAPKFPAGWSLGKPDVVIGMQEPYTVDADGRDEYHCFIIPTGYDADRYIRGLEFHPGNRRVVHHMIAYLDTSHKARKLAAKSGGKDYVNPTPGGGPGFFPAAFLGGWAPGNDARLLPDGLGLLLPKGADVVLEVHYHKSGKAEKDHSEFGIQFCKAPVDKRIRIMPVVNPYFRIAPGDRDAVVNASMPVMNDVTLLGVTPHMHMIGRSMKVWVTDTDKKRLPLVNVPDWDFNWQLNYGFKQPIKLKSGAVVSLEAHYDNSDSNPKQPNRPPKPVSWGEQTTDEMCIAFVAYTADDEHLTQGKPVHDAFDFLTGGSAANVPLPPDPTHGAKR